MITGDCPYCEAPMWNPLARDRELPCFQRLISECCGKVVWLLHSRIYPEAMTEEVFLERYEWDEEKKDVKEKYPAPVDKVAEYLYAQLLIDFFNNAEIA
jgi:hypothetical protein